MAQDNQTDPIINPTFNVALSSVPIANAVEAIRTNHSFATEPTVTTAYQWWADTTTGLLKIRNAADSAWVTIATLATGALDPTAIHTDGAGEISGLTQKASPLGADHLVIESDADGDAKRRVLLSDLPAGGEINDLEGDGAANIATDELVMGTGAGTVLYQKISILTEEVAPVTGDWLLGETAAGALVKVDPDNVTGSGISAIVQDTTPQLGGQLDVNGFAIGDGTLEVLAFVETPSAINHIEIENAIITFGPILRAAGDDANVDLRIQSQGAGLIQLEDDTNVAGDITLSGTVDTRDVATDGTKLDGIETAATADQTDAEIRTAVEAATDSNVFTDADHSKLDGIEAAADVTDTTNVAAALPVADATSLVNFATDKEMRIDVGAVADSTVRVLTMPDQDIDLTPRTGAFEASGREKEKSFTLPDPVATDIFGVWITNKAITVTEIQAICHGGTSAVVNVRNHTVVAAAGGTLIDQITPTTAIVSETTISSASVVADRVIFFELGTVVGSPNSVTVTINYTED